MMKVNKPVSIAIAIVIILLLVFLFLIPRYNKLHDAQENLVNKQAEYDGKSVYYAKVADIIKNIDEKKEALGKIDSALPSDFSLSSLVYFFQKEGSDAGVTIGSMTLSQILPPDKNTKIKKVVFNLHVLGTYENFKKFLSSLDESARLIEVNSISFATTTSLKQPKNKSQTYDFNMEILTHTY